MGHPFGAPTPVQEDEDLSRRAAGGDVAAALALGDRYRQTQDWPRALACYCQAAEGGSVSGQRNAGIIACNLQDWATAERCLTQATAQKDPYAYYLLGCCRRDGRTGPPDPREGERLFRRAALYGVPEAQFALAQLCQAEGATGLDQFEFWLSCAYLNHYEPARHLFHLCYGEHGREHSAYFFDTLFPSILQNYPQYVPLAHPYSR